MKLRFQKFNEQFSRDGRPLKDPPEPPYNRMIGIELRLYDAMGVREEVAIFPLDVILPSLNASMPFDAEVTIHTAAGDATSQKWRLPL